MRRTFFFIVFCALAAQLPAQNCPVVDFGDNLFWYVVGIPPYRSGSEGAKNPERIKLAEGEFINGHSFSMDTPLSMVSADYNTKGNNTRFYGGMKTHTWDNPSNKYSWSEGGCNVDHDGYDDLNYMGFALESLSTPEKPGCRQTAIGVWMWKKEDFLNGGDRYPVTFDDNSRVAVFLSRTYPANDEQAKRLIAEGKIPGSSRPFTDTYANQQLAKVPRENWRGWESIHLVVQDGDQFYVAEPAYAPVQQTLFEVYPAKVKWAKYNPQGPWDFEFDSNTATFEPHEFKDVRAAGWMICKNKAENSTLWCKWYGFGMDAVVNRPADQQAGWNLSMKPVGKDGLYMAQTEVSYEQWRKVWKWGQRNAYCMHRSFAFERDGNMGSMQTDSAAHTQKEPVTGITWHDAVVWCNALSVYEGLTPCYYTDPEFKNVLRISRDGTDMARSLIPPVVHVNPEADGYRLPTLREFSNLNSEIPNHKIWNYLWDRSSSVCDMSKDNTRTVAGGGDRAPAVSALPSGEMPSRGHYAIGFRPVRGAGKTVGKSASDMPSWTFDAEQIIPPASPVAAAVLAPAIEMIPMKGFEGGKTEVTYAQWKAVFQWAEVNGYRFSWDGDMGSMAWDPEPSVHTPDEPVTCIGLLDAAIWCNALSEMKGLKPCYYNDEAKTEPLRMANPFRVNSFQWADGGPRDGGQPKVFPKFLFYMDETAGGFRLPMSDEWSAMCGGFYPSGSSFDPATGWCAENSGDRTHPAGTKTPTGPGFFDLSGNVFEWAIAKAKSPDLKNRRFFDIEARGGGFRSDDRSPKTLGKTPVKGAWEWVAGGTAVPELGLRVVRTLSTDSAGAN